MISLPNCNGFARSCATPDACRIIFDRLESAPRAFHDPKECSKSPVPVKKWLYRRLLEPLLALLRAVLLPRQLALSIAFAIVVGNIPILGVSTILCAIIALIFRLNLPTIQLVQAAMAPTQLLLIIPFVRFGEWILGAPRQIVSVKAGLALLSHGVWQTIVVLRDAIFHAALAWALIAPFCIYLLQRLLTPVFERLAAQVRRQPIG
jgi:uncharacterized protein (DUF2062 family)